jgi:hypothetical protein
MQRVAWSRGAILPVLFLTLAGQLGCVTRWLGLSGGEPHVTGSKGSVPLSKVERLLDGFAERQVTLVADACEAVRRETPAPDVRRRAHHLKLANGTAVYDVVTQPEPLARLAGLYLLVELEHLVWVEEGWAVKQFGESGKNRLVPAVEEARREMSTLADLAMKPDRRREFDGLIHRWRARNPEVEFVAGIRFGTLSDKDAKSILESASSLFDVINPLDETSQSVERARMLADRAFFYSKRLLQLADWQAEAALQNTIALPEVRSILANLDRLVDSFGQIAPTIRELPDRVAREREALLGAWDSRSQEVLATVREIRGSIVDARELAERATEAGKAFDQTFRSLHEVTGSPEKRPEAPPSRPFDIREYTSAAAELKDAAREGTGLLAAGRSLIDHVTWRAIEVLLILFALLAGYRLVVARWIRPGPPGGRGTESRRPPSTWESRHGSPT